MSSGTPSKRIPTLPWAPNDDTVPSPSSSCIRRSPQLRSSQMQELLVNTATGVSCNAVMFTPCGINLVPPSNAHVNAMLPPPGEAPPCHYSGLLMMTWR